MASNQRRYFAIAVTLSLIVFVGFLVIDQRFLGMGYVHGCSELCFISEIQDTNSNTSYSAIFHGVNFVFLYSTLPVGVDENGTEYIIGVGPLTGHFLITFPDNKSETLALNLGTIMPVAGRSFLETEFCNHIRPMAGVASDSSTEMHGKWVLLVSV